MSKQYIDSIIFADGLPVVHAGPGGHATAKEECWVTVGPQQVKQAFTNIVHAKDLKGTTSRVFVQGYPIATLASYASQSYGDASAEGGVKSGTTLGPARFQTSSSTYILEGNPAVRHGDVLVSNEGNTEPTTWNQAGSARDALAQIKSDPIEVLPNPAALNIQLIRSPAESLKPAAIHQSFSVTHEVTGHVTYSTYGVFKNIDNVFLWHDDKLREGTYQVNDFYPHCGKMMTIPLGKIKTVSKNDKTPGMKLVPLAFRRYDDMQYSIEGAKSPSPETYIYLFKDAYLWRVFHVNQHGNIYEKDLSSERKNLKDPTSAQIKQGVLLPIEDAEGKHEFYVAVSKLALSWDTLHQLGGLHPEDPRFEAKHRLPIAPDPEFIKARLQKIDIHALIAQGENLSPIPLKNTEDELLRAFHEKEPPQSNWNWIVDRDRFNHSKGVKSALKDLYWHVEAPPLYTPTLQNLNAQALASKFVPGAAVILLDDPLSRLMSTAEELIYQEAKYGAYTQENGELYELSTMIGHVLDSVKNHDKDHKKHIDNEARLKFIDAYDKMTESYLACMKEGVRKLIFWYEATHQRGQWEDFHRVPPNPDATKETAWEYHRLRKNIYAAFMMEPDGYAYLRDDLARADGYEMGLISLVQKLSKFEAIPRMVTEASMLLASVLKPGSESLAKIQGLIENCMRIKLNVKIVSHSLDEFKELHEKMLKGKKGPRSGTVLLQAGRVNGAPAMALTNGAGKLIKVVYLDEVPAFEWFEIVPGKKSPRVASNLEAINNFATKVNNVPAFRVAASAFSIFNAMFIAEQMKEMEAMGDLSQITRAILQAEMMRNALVAGHLAIEAGLMTRGIAEKQWADNVSDFAKGMNFTLVIAGGILDGLFTLKYLSSGENDLAVAHLISLSSGWISFRANSSRLRNTPGAALYKILAFIVAVVGAYLIYRFTKSSLEKWLYTGYWGEKYFSKDEINHSIEKLYYVMTLVNLEAIEALDEKGLPRPLSFQEQEQAGLTYLMESLNNKGAPRPLPFSERKDSGSIDPLWMVKNPTETLRFKLTTTDKIQNRCEFSIYVQTSTGLYLLKDEDFIQEPLIKTDTGFSWAVRVPRKYFSKNGMIGKICLASYDSESDALIGKDAYEISCNDFYDSYSAEKVIYEHQS